MSRLYVVPTPIGNLEDITLRALRILKEVDVILAEDTRNTGFLLKHFEISKPMWSHHAHNEHNAVESVAEKIISGTTVALVSDAGTPGISDPGFMLIRECIRKGIHVECLPGPTAFVPALVQSGLPCDQFLFAGFLPQKKGRQTRLTALAALEKTIVLYESPFRLVKALAEIAEHFGADRPVAVCRELTKLHEETFRGTTQEAHDHFAAKTVKGEIVIVIGGNQLVD
ncbi:MAG TPA: 16S rRNA (cytidine(1402)-2'-O)-methyltransferase [Bacteroidia bacterium]|nr:16S rRNA (cytidine(1402)-2'-O)-methyltransferase [Bacteroidia bacterium]